MSSLVRAPMILPAAGRVPDRPSPVAGPSGAFYATAPPNAKRTGIALG